MKGDDDEEEQDVAIGIGRYPVMPSLVALQQMRNRLQLAHLGKKLMKWTALALGKELRVVAMEMERVMRDLEDAYHDAFISLARGRYYRPELGATVLNEVALPPHEAIVKVHSSIKNVVACRVYKFEVTRAEERPYQYVAMDKGGVHLQEARRIWYELILKLVLIAELRDAFVAEEMLHKNATKRQNALSKIVIPRIQATIRYIILELEELAREDFYRIKLIKQRKRRDADALKAKQKKQEQVDDVCPVCEAKIEPMPPIPDAVLVTVVEPLAELAPEVQTEVAKELEMTPAQTLEYLLCVDEKLHEILNASRSILVMGAAPDKIELFLDEAKEIRKNLKRIAKNPLIALAVRDRLLALIERLTCAINSAKELKKQMNEDLFPCKCTDTDFEPSNEMRNMVVAAASRPLPKPVQKSEWKPQPKPPMLKLTPPKPEPKIELQQTKMVKLEKKQTTGTPTEQRVPSEAPKTDQDQHTQYLKAHLDDIEKLISTQKQLGLATPSMEKFLVSCREIRDKLDTADMEQEIVKTRLQQPRLNCPEATTECPSWIMAFIHKGAQNSEVKKKPAVLRNVQKSLDDTVKLISKFAEDGLVTPSVERFIRDYGRPDPVERDRSGTDPEVAATPTRDDAGVGCPETCTCDELAAAAKKLVGSEEK